MKNPLWIINSALIITVSVLIILIILLRGEPPKRESLIPKALPPLQKGVSSINPKSIYENDLFRTHIRPVFPKQEKVDPVVVMPTPPQEHHFVKKPKMIPEFLPPLDIELKGIIFNSNRLQSRIIVMDKKTKYEELYKIGDTIEDANLVFIDKNKAIFVRSNGQQEAIFITPQAAQRDPIYNPHISTNSIEQVGEAVYTINLNQFNKEVSSVAQFLDLLDITTAFDKGISIGAHIGKASPKSIGAALGLQQGDIILSINNTPTTSTSDRVAIFKQLEKNIEAQPITVKILRKGSTITHTYTLQQEKHKKKEKTGEQLIGNTMPMQQVMQHQQKIEEVTDRTLTQTQTNKKIADILKKDDRKKMAEYGGRNNLLQR